VDSFSLLIVVRTFSLALKMPRWGGVHPIASGHAMVGGFPIRQFEPWWPKGFLGLFLFLAWLM